MDPGGHQVTHVLLQAGHMRGRKEVAIPVGAVTRIGTMIIHLGLTRHRVKDLPPVDIDHPAGRPVPGHSGPRSDGDHLVHDDAEAGARGLSVPVADMEEVRSQGWPA